MCNEEGLVLRTDRNRDNQAGCRGVMSGTAIAALLWLVLALLIWRACT